MTRYIVLDTTLHEKYNSRNLKIIEKRKNYLRDSAKRSVASPQGTKDYLKSGGYKCQRELISRQK